MDACMDACMDSFVDAWVGACMGAWVDAWMDGCKDACMDVGWMHAWMKTGWQLWTIASSPAKTKHGICVLSGRKIRACALFLLRGCL